MRYRSAWMPEAEIIERIAAVNGGDIVLARRDYLAAVREGALEVWGRRPLFAERLERIPVADWWNCEWFELPDRLASGFYFKPMPTVDFERSLQDRLVSGFFTWPGPSWYDREAKGTDVAGLWPGRKKPSNLAQLRDQAIQELLDSGVLPPENLPWALSSPKC
jgi:hypothetical protein